jgi:hypothetical protein
VLLLVLVPLIATQEIRHALGPGGLRQLLLQPSPQSSDDETSTRHP